MMLNDESLLRIRPDVRFRVVGEEAVIVRQETADVMAVNEVGASILTLLQAGKNLGEVVLSLLEEYDVDREPLRREVEAFLLELREAGVLQAPEEA